eukprot:g3946.t1
MPVVFPPRLHMSSLSSRSNFVPRGDPYRGPLNRRLNLRIPRHPLSYIDRHGLRYPIPLGLQPLQATISKNSPETDEGDGSDGGAGGNSKKTGEGDDDGGGGSLSPELQALLAGASRSVNSFPDDFAKGLISGKVSPTILARYLDMEANFIIRLLFKIAGFRERLLADPGFLFKVAVECGIGICTKSAAEYAKRQDSFWKELDFVMANVIMAILADFMLVWLPAPTLVYNRKFGDAPRLLRWFRSCPENAFQVVQKGTDPFSAFQRFGSVIRNGTKLMVVGLLCSGIGVASTNALLKLRSILDPHFVQQNPSQDIVKMALGYGVYMATSSNLRYQIVAGIFEERGFEVIFRQQRELCHFLSLILRTGNTFLGSLLWVDFCRITGLQKKQTELIEAGVDTITGKN